MGRVCFCLLIVPLFLLTCHSDSFIHTSCSFRQPWTLIKRDNDNEAIASTQVFHTDRTVLEKKLHCQKRSLTLKNNTYYVMKVVNAFSPRQQFQHRFVLRWVHKVWYHCKNDVTITNIGFTGNAIFDSARDSLVCGSLQSPFFFFSGSLFCSFSHDRLRSRLWQLTLLPLQKIHTTYYCSIIIDSRSKFRTWSPLYPSRVLEPHAIIRKALQNWNPAPHYCLPYC